MTRPETRPQVHSRREAQARLDRAQAFIAELAALEAEGVLALSAEQRGALEAHYDRLRRELAARFDIDASLEQRRLSWGMTIASLLGALALAAAVFFGFYRVWGHLPTLAQVAILTAAPILGVVLTDRVARRERVPWFTGLAALVAAAAAVLNLSVLGGIFNITPSQNAFLVWSAFCLALAYAYGLRVVLAFGILFLLGYLSASLGTWGGVYWLSFGQRPESFIPAGLALCLVPLIVRQRRHPEFAPLYWVLGLLAVFLPILVLSNWGRASYLMLEPGTVEILYQILGFLFSAGVIAAGVRWRTPSAANTGVVFFVILLYTKFFDWWWDWMPKYLFFLLLGLVALLLLFVLRRLRAGLTEATP